MRYYIVKLIIIIYLVNLGYLVDLGACQDSGETKIKTSPVNNQFNGWSQLYKGYGRTPLMFYSGVDGKARAYPPLASPNRIFSDVEMSSDQVKEGMQRSLKRMNLGVDEEINKTSVSIYRPLYGAYNAGSEASPDVYTIGLAGEFASDSAQNDSFVSLFKTIRAISTLTLSYLDKTVAAGLSTTQSQVDNHVTQNLLQQISWNSDKLANPNRSFLHQDVDDKVEACLTYGGIGENISEAYPNIVGFPSKMKEKGSVCENCPESVYDYCICCSQALADANWTVQETTGATDEFDQNAKYNGASVNHTRLSDRIFFGNSLGTEDPKFSSVQLMANQFRFVYGDILLGQCSESQGDSRNCQMKVEFQYPQYAPQDLVRLFRDGIYIGGKIDNSMGQLSTPSSGEDNKKFDPYVQTLAGIDLGICPSIKQIMCGWPATSEITTEINRHYFRQASLGRLITGADIKNMFIMLGRPEGSLSGSKTEKGTAFDEMGQPTELSFTSYNEKSCEPDSKTGKVSWEPEGRFRRWLETYCDASAVSAFKKFHYRLMAVVEDHLTLNQKVTEYERSKARSLMERVTKQIALAEMDADSSSRADQMLAGLTQEGNASDARDTMISTDTLSAARENSGNAVGFGQK
jgi:hypothetical protein